MKIADDTFLGNSECEWVNPFALRVAKTSMMNLDIFYLQKHFYGLWEAKKQNSFKYFVNFRFIPTFFFKSMREADNTF